MKTLKKTFCYLALSLTTIFIFYGCATTPSNPPANNTLQGWNWQTSNATFGLFDVQFVDANNGFIIVADTFDVYKLLKTTDGGTTWSMNRYSNERQISSHFYINSSTGWAVGVNILKTVDGGNTWSTYALPAPISLIDVYFSSPNIGIALGNYYWNGSSYNAVEYKTIDGGISWNQSSISSIQYLNSAHFINANTGWAGGYTGMYPNTTGIIAKTLDGGVTWTVIPISNSVTVKYVYFTDANTGWSYGLTGNQLQTWKSMDGGSTWSTNQTPGGMINLNSIQFINSLTGWAVGSGYSGTNYSAKISRTNDGGTTWSTQTLPTLQQNSWLNSVCFIDAQTGWVVGGETVNNLSPTEGLILKTENGGN